MSDKPRILILDLESFPQLQLRWRYFEKGVAFHVLKPNTVMMVAYRWLEDINGPLGLKKARVISEDQGPDYVPGVQNDAWLMQMVWDLVADADFVVAHYGIGFDRPMLEARMWEHGVGPMPPGNWIDSKAEAAKFMRGSGYSMALGNLAAWLELGEKLETNKSLWLRCMDGVRAAWTEMKTYAKQDVDVLHDLFLDGGPYMQSMIFNMGHWYPGEEVCSWCGSKELQKRGFHYTRASKFQRYLCLNCGRWPRSAKRIPQREADGTNVPLR